MANYVIDPMCLLGMGIYHDKLVKTGTASTTYGLIYTVQHELTERIFNAAPLGTNLQKKEQILERMIEYQKLRLRKADSSINYYDQFSLIGYYVMKDTPIAKGDTQKYLSDQLSKRGSPYKLELIKNIPKILKLEDGKEKEIMHIIAVQTIAKYCLDAMAAQSTKDESVLQKTMKKQEHLLKIYSEKMIKLQHKLKTETDMEKIRQIYEILENYGRIQHFNYDNKMSAIQAINYSIVQSLVLLEKYPKK